MPVSSSTPSMSSRRIWIERREFRERPDRGHATNHARGPRSSPRFEDEHFTCPQFTRLIMSLGTIGQALLHAPLLSSRQSLRTVPTASVSCSKKRYYDDICVEWARWPHHPDATNRRSLANSSGRSPRPGFASAGFLSSYRIRQAPKTQGRGGFTITFRAGQPCSSTTTTAFYRRRQHGRNPMGTTGAERKETSEPSQGCLPLCGEEKNAPATRSPRLLSLPSKDVEDGQSSSLLSYPPMSLPAFLDYCLVRG